MSSTKSERMVALLNHLLTPLVQHPEDLRVTPVERSGALVLEVRVNKEDMGKVIGRGGRRAEALRTMMKAQATRLQTRVLVDILD